MLKSKFPESLLADLLEEFSGGPAEIIKEIAVKNDFESLNRLLSILANSKSGWMSWREAIAAFNSGEVEKVREAAERAERIDKLHLKVCDHFNTSP